MQIKEYGELASILQNSISPVVLISGIGLIVLSLTNRYGRTIDRARVLKKELNKADNNDTDIIIKEINILYKRSNILLRSINAAIISILFVSLLIITLFAIYLFQVNLFIIGSLCFIASLTSLIVSILLFIKDMSLSLQALTLDIKEYLK